jgi:hypothetical protein
MDVKGYVFAIARTIGMIVVSITVAVIGINVFGFLVSGREPGYDSAQGGGSFYFFMSVFLGPPLGLVLSIAAVFYRKRRHNK